MGYRIFIPDAGAVEVSGQPTDAEIQAVRAAADPVVQQALTNNQPPPSAKTLTKIANAALAKHRSTTTPPTANDSRTLSSSSAPPPTTVWIRNGEEYGHSFGEAAPPGSTLVFASDDPNLEFDIASARAQGYKVGINYAPGNGSTGAQAAQQSSALINTYHPDVFVADIEFNSAGFNSEYASSLSASNPDTPITVTILAGQSPGFDFQPFNQIGSSYYIQTYDGEGNAVVSADQAKAMAVAGGANANSTNALVGPNDTSGPAGSGVYAPRPGWFAGSTADTGTGVTINPDGSRGLATTTSTSSTTNTSTTPPPGTTSVIDPNADYGSYPEDYPSPHPLPVGHGPYTTPGGTTGGQTTPSTTPSGGPAAPGTTPGSSSGAPQGGGGDHGGGDQGSKAQDWAAYYFGSWGMDDADYKKLIEIMSKYDDPNAAVIAALAFIRGTQWYDRTFPGIKFGIAKGMFSDENGYRDYVNQVNQYTMQYLDRNVSGVEIAGYLQGGLAPTYIGKLYGAGAWWQSQAPDVNYLTGAFGQQLKTGEPAALAQEQAGLDNPLGAKLATRLQQASARMQKIFEGTVASPASLTLGNQGLNAPSLLGQKGAPDLPA